MTGVPQKAPYAEARTYNQRIIQTATHTPAVAVPSTYRLAPKQKGIFSTVTQIELTSEEAKTLGEALSKPAPPANAHLTSILKRASKW